jgi:acetyl-CoA carboxylase biotin carboxylase subunit
MFVANRGEIAVRVIRACSELGIETVLGVSEADRESLGARLATRSVCLGPAPAALSYLSIPTNVEAARGTSCDAVHPGYGFLAERPAFATACEEAGLVFIGPSSDAIASMGDKARARQIAIEAGVAVVPGSAVLAGAGDARRAVAALGYPVLLKACAGGGGRGMRVVHGEDGIEAAYRAASAEAQAAFGDGALYLERYIPRARHLEVQVMGDGQGGVLHFFERDCSIQRRHQKLIEESPSTSIGDDDRHTMISDAIKLAQAVRYRGAGTVEFIYDLDRRTCHFLEMNTRIQVEHPVTEAVTGIDLVQEQIRVCAGLAFSMPQHAVRVRGHAIECRVNAEDPLAEFQPSPGVLHEWRPPDGEGVRVDSHCFPGYRVPPYYDSLLAKLIVHAASREDAISKMDDALRAFVARGVSTTLPFHRAVMADNDYRRGDVTTAWVEHSFMEHWRNTRPIEERRLAS